MSDQIKLLPCPFCEGPPVPIVQNDIPNRGAAPVLDYYSPDGLAARAFVFCHECGVEGPAVDDIIYDGIDYLELEAEAVRLWQQRDNRHRALFDGGEAEGLNLYPRRPS